MGVQLAQEVGADVVTEILEYFPFQLFIDQVPQQGALAGRGRFQQVGYIAGAQAAIEDAGNLLERTTVQASLRERRRWRA